MRLVLMLVMFSTFLFSDVKSEWLNMSEEEQLVIINSYYKGNYYNVGYTLAAIAWIESRGGRWRIGTSSSDYGIYHVNIHWYLKELGVKDTMYNRSKYATRIMIRPDIEEEFVINKLVKLHKQYKSWRTVWYKYNGSKEYVQKIADRIKYIKMLIDKGLFR